MSITEETAIRFVRLAPEHVDAVVSIEQDSYPDPWTPGMFQQELRNSASHFYVALQGETVVGYAGFWLVLEEGHITKVTVAAPYRGRGFGQELMGHLLRKAQLLGAESVRLEVREGNWPARALYEKLGFRSVGFRKGYYTTTNETAVLMEKGLQDE
jgi:ribosomal-protein-alanine N-acetyltransferase